MGRSRAVAANSVLPNWQPCYASLNVRVRPRADLGLLETALEKQMSKNDETPEIYISLSADEALVLFEFLSRFEESYELTIVDQAEERALSNLLGPLQKQLVTPFRHDYLVLLEQARNKLRNDLS